MEREVKKLIDWSEVTIEQASKWATLQSEYLKQINEEFPVPEETVIYEWFKTHLNEIPTTLEEDPKERTRLTGEALVSKYKEYAITTQWIFENFRDYANKAVLFWTNKQQFLTLKGEDDDYILGLFSMISSCPLPEPKGVNKFKHGKDWFHAIKGDKETPLKNAKFWNLVEGLSVRGSKKDIYNQAAYIAAIFYWKEGETPNEDLIEERKKEFMTMDVSTGLNVLFFLTDLMNGLVQNTVSSLKKEMETLKQKKRA